MNRAVGLLAFDLGAESGRAVLGQLDDDHLELSEIHRFPNGPVRVLDDLHWDVLRLWSEMKRGLELCARKAGGELAGIGVDTWGVDFALLGADGSLLGNPYHYRHPQTEGMMKEAFRRVSRQEIFERTGIQFMQINTLYHLLAMAVRNAPALEVAHTFLTMPDLFNFWLTGQKVCEFTNATTTQLYDPREGAWAGPLLEKLGLPVHILPGIVPPGTVLGPLLPAVTKEAGLGEVPVIAPACHDTGSAVAAVPARDRHWAYISSGTWSLIGVEVAEPLINAQSLAHNFTNEGGVCGTFRFLKNVMGLWLVQECKRVWAQAGDRFSYDDLTQMAARAEPFKALVDPDCQIFLRPGDMPARMRTVCRKTGQAVPGDKGNMVRCILESLALKYRYVLERLEAILGHEVEIIHIAGGGTRNRLLCQFTADATQRPVIAGPTEATATGNIIMQALALGHVASLEEGREIVRRSFKTATYEPRDADRWDEAYVRFLRVLEQAESLPSVPVAGSC